MVKICMKNTRALFKGYKKKKMTIRSKHNDLLNYFIHDARDLSPAYLASCRKFLKEIIKQLNKENAPPDGWKPEDKVQAPSTKHQAPSLTSLKL